MDQIACFVGPAPTQIKLSQTKYGADYRPGSCSRLQLVFVHAENDTTMPWGETEALFKLTLAAAVETTSPRDGAPKDLKVVDLGEAGRQEVWQAGSKCIQKTIAKHGGKRPLFQYPGVCFGVACLAGRPSRNLFVTQQPLASLTSSSIFAKGLRLFQVSATCSRPVEHAAAERPQPCLYHAVIDLVPRFPGSLVRCRLT